MNGARRVLQVLAELRRRGALERAEAVAQLGRLSESAALRRETARAQLQAHATAARTALTEEEQRLRAGLGTVADLERWSRFEERSRGTLQRLERQADDMARLADEAFRAEREARVSLAAAVGERAAADSLLARRTAEASRRMERKVEEAAEDVLRARASEERFGRLE
jgi:hypothetical protein